MASEASLKRLEDVKRDLASVLNSPNFVPIRNMSALKEQYDSTEKLARKWHDRAEPWLTKIEDEALEPLIIFLRQIVNVADGQSSGQSVPDALRNATTQFKRDLPMLIYGLLEASGASKLSDEDISTSSAKALQNIHAATAQGSEKIDVERDKVLAEIENKVREATAEVEAARDKANEISVKGAQDQFAAAASSLRVKATAWALVTGLLFVVLFIVLFRLLKYPPPLISAIVTALSPQSKQVALPVSVPLLVVASAYYTSIRLALIVVLGVGLVFSLRMTRAYFHMIEHNHHKSRVTNSIEAFVASVRTNEQKDLVLSKLVDSVTQFGDSGILSKEADGTSIPAVVIDAITKNIGKSS